MRQHHYLSPCGWLVLGSLSGKLCVCDWLDSSHRRQVDIRLAKKLGRKFETGISPVIEQAISQLDEYFAGKRQVFDVPLILSGTPFQITVWRQLFRIPYGTTLTYADIARRAGFPNSVRAVANAIGANGLSLFVPCHRVVASDGSIGGYAGGIDTKRTLLHLEAAATNMTEES